MKHPFNTPQASRVKPLGANQTEVVHGSGMIVLYSYETPVCVRHHGEEYYTTAKYSRTTSKHINAWKSEDAKPVTQQELEAILAYGVTATASLH